MAEIASGSPKISMRGRENFSIKRLSPRAESELREASDWAKKVMFRLRAEFIEDEQVQEFFVAWDLSFRKRRDIIRESELNAQTNDAAWKPILH